MSQQRHPMIGKIIGQYTVESLISEDGGMADVLRGKHLFSGKTVAIKLMKPQFSYDNKEILRFQNEATRIDNLEHEHLIPILDCGTYLTQTGQKLPYMIMPLADDNLQGIIQKLGKTTFSLTEILPYLWPIAQVLDYLHQQSIVHRDFKPANVLVKILNNEKKKLLLSDLGISVVLSKSIELAKHTIIGTPPYMAPEQFEGRADPRTDQYAVAIWVYAMLSGKVPFAAGDFLAYMDLHKNQRVPEIPEVGKDSNYVILRALSKKPEHRFDTIIEFVQGLQDIVDSQREASQEANDQLRKNQQQELEKLQKQQLDQMRWEKSQLTLTIDGLKKSMDDLQQQTNDQFTQANEYIQQLQQEKADLQKQIRRINAEKEGAIKLNELREADLNELMQKYSQLQGEQKSLEQQRQELEKNLAGEKLQVRKLNQRLIILQESQNRLTKSLQDSQKENADMQETIKQQKELLEQLQQTLQEKIQQLEKTALQKDVLEANLANMQKSKTDFQSVEKKLQAAFKNQEILQQKFTEFQEQLAEEKKGEAQKKLELIKQQLKNAQDMLNQTKKETPKQMVSGHTLLIPSEIIIEEAGLGALSWSPTKPILSVIRYTNQTSFIINPRNGETRADVADKKTAYSNAWAPDGTKIAIGNYNAVTVKGKKGFSTQTGQKQIGSITWSPDGTKLATSGQSDTIWILDTTTGKRLHKVKDKLFNREWEWKYFPIFQTAWSPDGTVLAISNGKSIQFLNIRTGKILEDKWHCYGRLTAWSPDGSLLIIKNYNSIARVGKYKDEIIFELDSDKKQISDIAWSPDGNKLAIAYGNTVHIIKDKEGEQISIGDHLHTSEVNSVAWSPDSKSIASCDFLTLHIWKVPEI